MPVSYTACVHALDPPWWKVMERRIGFGGPVECVDVLLLLLLYVETLKNKRSQRTER